MKIYKITEEDREELLRLLRTRNNYGTIRNMLTQLEEITEEESNGN